jgi:hypothetical protein
LNIKRPAEGAANTPTGLTLTMERAMPKAASSIAHLRELADDLHREVELAPFTNKYTVTLPREFLARIEAALRFAVNPTEEFVDRVAHAIVAATAPLFRDFDAARDAARAAIEVIGL